MFFKKTFTVQDINDFEIINIEDNWPEQVKFQDNFGNVKVELEPGIIGPVIPISNGCKEVIDKEKTNASIWRRAFSRMFK